MRSADSYRGRRRNEARSARKLGEWRATAATRANTDANLDARAAQARAAREHVGNVIAENAGIPPSRLIDPAFREFYAAQPRTRVVSRILRSLSRAA